MSTTNLIKTTLALETRLNVNILNEIDRGTATAGNQAEVEALKKKFSSAIHRTTGPCLKYNCHGLTFASRRTKIWDTKELLKILEHDNYVQVYDKDVLPGDVILYRAKPQDGGEIEHSGVVVEVNRAAIVSIPRILSKWGKAQEVVHYVKDCPYQSPVIEYYRVMP